MFLRENSLTFATMCVCELLFLLATILRLWEAILANFSKLNIA